jgi:hypothetical protein
MLRGDVVEAVRQGQFNIYPINTVDEGVALLTGIPAGEPDEDGNYPPETINGRVMTRLTELALKRQKFGEASKSKDRENDESAAGEGGGDDGTPAK